MDKEIQRAINHAEKRASAMHDIRAPLRETKQYQDSRKCEIERRAKVTDGSKNGGHYK